MPPRLEFGFGPGRSSDRRADPTETRPFRILLLANLSGPGTPSKAAPVDCRAMMVDLDNFESRLGAIAPAVDLGGAPWTIRSIEDFHPDTLVSRAEAFAAYRARRDQLRDPEGAARLARELGDADPVPAAEPAAEAGAAEDDADTLSRLLGKPKGQAPTPGRPDVSDLVRRLAGAATSPAPTEPAALRERIQSDAALLLRRLLAQPDFRSLEATWRSIDSLIHGVELDDELQLAIANVHGIDPATALDALLQPAAHGDEPWSVVLLDRAFGTGTDDLELLRRLGETAGRAGLSCIATASPALLGMKRLTDGSPIPADDPALADWNRFRLEPAAAHVGLMLPRILLRNPYGAAADPIDSFPFEEIDGGGSDALLWGSAAIACGLLLGRGFRNEGRHGSPLGELDWTDLPAYVRDVDGEQRLQPCAEILMPEAMATDLLARGLMPVMSHAHSNAARLLRFQSVAQPATPLAGPWS
ncbi:hypothetical protein ABI59_02625 [Acidobacteria bacterium Mor1]|nr:hypothetical protein ABI59_02625 [Acidobacteria bacterium Mor1]